MIREFSEDKMRQLALIDRAARGDIDAAADLGEGYIKGSFGEKPNPVKALKWCRYAAKHGSIKAAEILREIEGRKD